MYSMKFDWKTFKVHLPHFEQWVKSVAGASYKGNSADSHFTLWFDAEPSQQIKDTIQSNWDSLREDTENVYISQAQKRNRAVSAATVSIPVQNWDQLLPSERKIMMKMELTDTDKDELITKYPQV